MAKVNICNVVVMDNPSSFSNPFQFEITFDCYETLTDDLEWAMVYVGSAESEAYDQLLDTVLVGPIPEGRHMFVFQADPPDPSKLPPLEVVGVTVVLLTCGYRGQTFAKIGYYVVNEYTDPDLKENPPVQPRTDMLRRYVLSDQPRVTRFPIVWDQKQPGTVLESEVTQDTMEQNGVHVSTTEAAQNTQTNAQHNGVGTVLLA